MPRPGPGVDVREDLVLADVGHQQVLEEVARGDRAGAGRGLQVDGGAEQDEHRGYVGARVGVGDVAADRAAVADLGVADVAGGLGEHRAVRGENVGSRDLGVGGQRADPDRAARLGDALEFIETADVDDDGRLRESQLHHRDQAVAAGHQLRVLVLLQQAEGFIDRSGAAVIELGWVHIGAPDSAASSVGCGILDG